MMAIGSNEWNDLGDRASVGACLGKAERRGLLKLMLKLPEYRLGLASIGAKNSAADGLFEAYDDATDMMFRLLQDRDHKEELINEYRQICSEIETDVIRYVTDRLKCNPPRHRKAGIKRFLSRGQSKS